VTETSIFAPRATIEQVEEGRLFAPKFDADGLITCIVTDAWSAEVLMLAHMNQEALAKTLTDPELLAEAKTEPADLDNVMHVMQTLSDNPHAYPPAITDCRLLNAVRKYEAD